MVTELCKKEDLFDLLEEVGSTMERGLVKQLFKQICTGVQAAKQAGFAHLDIKLENILIGSDYNMRLSDFGFARKCDVP